MLTIEQMSRAHQELRDGIKNIQDKDEKKKTEQEYKIFLEYSEQYMQARLSTSYERGKDNERASCHDRVNVYIKGLASNLKKCGQSVEKIEEVLKINDKCCGDFACYIVFVESLCSG